MIILGETLNLKELCETVQENENILSGKQIVMMSKEGFLINIHDVGKVPPTNTAF